MAARVIIGPAPVVAGMAAANSIVAGTHQSPPPQAAMQLEDGWIIYRGRLCMCTSQDSSSALSAIPAHGSRLSPDAPSSSSRHRTLHSQAGTILLDHADHSTCVDETATRPPPIVAQQNHNDRGTSVMPEACRPGSSSSACSRVVIKTRLYAHFTDEQSAKLQYEALLLDKIYTAETGSSPSPTAKMPLTPHLRYLPDGRLALVQMDHGGVTVRQLAQTRVLDLPFSSACLQSNAFPPIIPSRSAMPPPTLATVTSALTITLAIARKLSVLHGLSVVLKSLRPNFLMLQPESGRVDLLELRFASLAAKEDRVGADFNLAQFSNTAWRYSAPEQSGKANRGIDTRTDLYSLGVMFYELLTGRQPFQSADTLELIHQHLARAPPQIVPRGWTTESYPQVFTALTVAAAIAQKLLQKQAEDRYQTTAGLIHDLTQVLGILQQESDSTTAASPSSFSTPSVLASFQIGQLDLYSTFRISQRLYGREDEVRQLIHAYQRICPSGGVRSPSIVNFSIATTPANSPCSSSSNMGFDTMADLETDSSDSCCSSTTEAISSIKSSAAQSNGPRGAANGSLVAPQLVLVSGYSGVGKTSLVDELHKHIVRQRGLFARGKFDLFKRDSSCLLQAFRQLIIQLTVTEPLTWKVRLLRALGENGQLICEVIPELTRLIGEQPPVSKVSMSESVSRFSMVFCQFVMALATAASPLTLFIDDLQWADSGSLALLRLLFDQESVHLLIIGAYRDNEVDATHPLTHLIAIAKAPPSDGLSDPLGLQQSRVTELKLRPLSLTHITQLLQDSFRCSEECVLPFAQLLAVKTQGNPFFISTMLRTFYDERLLTFNFQTAKWEPQLEAMRLSAVHQDVVEVLCKQMLTLTAESQTLLQFAACCGNTFALHTLSVVTQLSLHALIQSVREIEQAGLIACTQHAQDLVLLAETNRAPDPEQAEPSALQPSSHLLSSIVLTFLHDRIQLAAYKLIPLHALPALHRTIAHQLLSAYDDEESREYASEIASHINAGYLGEPASDDTITNDSFTVAAEATSQAWINLLTQDDLVTRIIDLELVAAAQAKVACAYDTAIQLLAAAVRLLSRKDASIVPDVTVAADSPSSNSGDPFPHAHPASWTTSHATCIHIYMELAQCFFLASNLPVSQLCVEYALSQLTDLHERSPFVVLQMQTLCLRSNLQGSINVGLHFLKELGVELLPAKITPELEAWLLDVPDIKDESTYRQHPLFRMEEMADPTEMEVLSAILTPLHYCADRRVVNVSITMADLGMRRGITPELSHGLGALATFCINPDISLWPTDAFSRAYLIARLSSLMLDQLDQQSVAFMRPRAECVLGGFIYPWVHSLRSCVSVLESAYATTMAQSQLELAPNLAGFACEMTWIADYRLDETRAKILPLHGMLTKRHPSSPMLVFCRRWLELAETIAGVHVSRPPLHEPPVPQLWVTTAIMNGTRHFYSGQMPEAVKELRRATSLATGGFVKTMKLASLAYYQCLAVLRVCPKALLEVSPEGTITTLPSEYDAALVTAHLTEADTAIAAMRLWASHAPMNFAHKLKLMQAERNRVAIFSHLACQYLMMATVELYEEAAEGAYLNEFHLEHALSLELLARFQLDCGRCKTGLGSLKRAYAAYADGQAVLKTDGLAAEFPEAQLRVSCLSSPPPTVMRPASPSVSRQTSTLTLAHSPSASSGSMSSSSSDVMSDHISMISSSCPASMSADVSRVNGGPRAQSAVAATQPVSSSSFDALSVLKATSTFSTEKDQKKLLKRLMRIVLETAGATRGALVLEDQNHEWAVELSASIDPDEPSNAAVSETDKVEQAADGFDPERPDGSEASSASTSDSGSSGATLHPHIRLGSDMLAVSSALPISVFNFVVGSVETVLLSDPQSRSEFSAFASDPYFSSHSPRALLCMPLLKGGVVFGVLYLENDFHAEAFTSSHIQLLQLLCSQAALSIDNARLYCELSQHNARLEVVVLERTRELELRNAQLQAAKEGAEKATRVKAEFLSNMSHEIRTPMNAVLGIGRLLSDTSLTLEQQQYVSMINNSGNLLLTIINDILDYSKIEAGRLTLNLHSSNLLDIVESTAMLCYDTAVTKSLELCWDVDPTLPANLLLDASRLQQILLNLLSNAIKFTMKGGSVTLRVRGRLFAAVGLLDGPSPLTKMRRLQEEKHRLDFSVTDTGIGISPAQLATLFRSFSQVQHVSGEYGGTGLGLVISKRLVEAMGGEMSVESQPGVGSTFSFFIPSTVESVEPSSPAASSPSMRTSLRTLSATSSPAPPRRRLADDEKKPPSVPRSPSMQLHGLSSADLRVLASARLVYVGERNAAIDVCVRLLEHYGSRVVVCSLLAEAAEYIQAHWPSPETSAAATASTTSEALIVDFNSPGVSEESFRAQISSRMSVRALLTYVKKQPVKPPSPGLASPPPGCSDVTVADTSASVTPPVIPLLSSTNPSSSLTPHQHFRSPSLSSESSLLVSPISSVPSSPLLASLNGSTLSSMRPLPMSVTRKFRQPAKQRVFLRELIVLLSTPLNEVDSSQPLSQLNGATSSSTSLTQTPHSSPPPKSSRILNIARQHPLRVLLAEDNQINQKLMLLVMRKLGYEIAVAANGQEVLAMLEAEAKKGREHEFECILMDASMDVMDGLECTRIIRAQQLPHRTRPFIIAQTANVTEGYQQLCKSAGMDRFCAKPIRIEELTRCLRAAHAAQTAASNSAAQALEPC